MTTVTALYNSLPSIGDADKKFVNRSQIFSKLSPLLAAHENKFGVCLVHRHCSLEEGEMMVATGNISQPERNVQCYPERWLATGEPYEFTRKPTRLPPQELLEEFQRIVHGVDVLGLFYIHDGDHLGGITIERTEGRKNIVEIVPRDYSSSSTGIATGWLPGPDGNTMLCECICTYVTHGECKPPQTPPQTPLPDNEC